MGPIDCLLAVLNTNPATLQVSDSLDQFVQTVLDRLRNSSELDEIVGDLISTDVKGAAADLETSLGFKEEGNKAFKQGRLEEALRHYTDALRFTNETLAAQWQHAARVHTNAAHCLLSLGDGNAQAALVHCQEALRLDSTYPKAAFWQGRALAAIGGSGQHSSADMQTPSQHCPVSLEDLVANRTPQLEVVARPGVGRTLVAAEPLTAGAIVLTDSPFALALSKRRRHELCSHCTAPLPLVPLPCAACPLALFCGARCRAAAAHRPGGCECGVPWTLLLPQDAVLASRIVRGMQTQEGLAPHIASLEGHWRAQPAGQLAELAVVAVLAAACSRRGVDALRHDDVATPATAILLALCQIAVNGIAVVPPLVRSPEDRCAAALYPTTAMLNHCCAPNASMTFEDNVLVVRVLRDLQPGEELSHCYGPQTGEHITPLRRRLLRQQYHFECRCDACLSSDMAAEAARVGLACPVDGCGGSIVLSGDVAHLTSLHDVPAGWLTEQCTRCKAGLTQQHRLSALQELRQARALRESVSDAAHPAEAAAMLLECQQRRCRHLHPDNELLGATADALADAYAAAGQASRAAEQCAASLDVMARSYEPGSTAVAHCKLKLAGLLQRAGTDAAERARKLRGEAAAVLRLHHGAAAATLLLQNQN